MLITSTLHLDFVCCCYTAKQCPTVLGDSCATCIQIKSKCGGDSCTVPNSNQISRAFGAAGVGAGTTADAVSCDGAQPGQKGDPPLPASPAAGQYDLSTAPSCAASPERCCMCNLDPQVLAQNYSAHASCLQLHPKSLAQPCQWWPALLQMNHRGCLPAPEARKLLAELRRKQGACRLGVVAPEQTERSATHADWGWWRRSSGPCPWHGGGLPFLG